MFAKKRIAILTLVLLACAAMLFGACAPTDPPDDSILKELVDTSSEVELLPESDYLAENEYMTINTVLSVTPTNVAVFGQLTEKAISEGIDSVRLSGGVDLVSQEQCVDGYFIIAIDLPGASRTTFAATAIKGEEEIGEPLTFSAPYDATAEGRLDGNSVSVGKNSGLYFTKYLDNYLSKSLYTASQVDTIKKTVSSTYRAYVERAKGNKVGMVYVFVPDVTTMAPEIFADKDVAEKDPDLLTRYEQIVTAISGTMANVVDMKTVLQEQLDNGVSIYDLYRRTDSHPTEYAALLMYQEVMKHIANADPDVSIRELDEYKAEKVTALGGDYVKYRDLDPELITEEITLYKPTFSYHSAVKAIKVYNDDKNGDYSLFTTINSGDQYTGGAERVVVDTDRTELPNVMIYRDECGIAASVMIADSCDVTLLGKNGDFAISLTDAGQYRDKDEGKSMMDYIVVFVSESNIANAFVAD
ncbi:MAG: hypothetical protein IJB88_07070 [Clostridia bacterium]|nr:hypothetical protein [Clostridia bacterium]